MNDDAREVVVVDVKIPFWSMVVLMVKWAIAAIPAVIILFVLSAIVSALLGGGAPSWRAACGDLPRGGRPAPGPGVAAARGGPAGAGAARRSVPRGAHGRRRRPRRRERECRGLALLELRHDVDDSCPIGADGRRRHTYDYREGGCRQVKDAELSANLGWGAPWTGSALVLRRG